MALKGTELTETFSGWEPHQFYSLTRATFKKRTPPHLKVYDMIRRPISPYYISVQGRGLCRVTSPVLIRIKYHPISLDVGSYHKPDVDDRVSLWSV